MPGHFTKIEVGDPHLLPQSVWERLPPSQKLVLTQEMFSSQRWEPLDQRRFRIEPESYRTEFSFANIGALGLRAPSTARPPLQRRAQTSEAGRSAQ
jgi:hypothetical protein